MARRRKAEDALLEFVLTAPFAIAGSIIAEGQRQIDEENRKKAILEQEQRRQEAHDNKIKIINDYLDNLQNYYNSQNKCLEFVSLKNNLSKYNKDVSKIVKQNTLFEVLNALKFGLRTKAIKILLLEEYTYNDTIKIISTLENSLSEYISREKVTHFVDTIGQYEFEPIEKIIHFRDCIENNKLKQDFIISCGPINPTEYVSAKSSSTFIEKISKALGRLFKIWRKVYLEYHLSRENTIIENITKDINEILLYRLNNDIRPVLFQELFDNSKFISKLPVIEKPNFDKFDIKIIENKLNEFESTKPKEEDIQVPNIYTWLSKINNDFIKNKIHKQYTKELSLWNKKKENIETELNTIRKKNEEYDKYQEYLVALENERNLFYKNQEEYNKLIEDKIKNFENGNKFEIQEFFVNSLELSEYPILKDKTIEISYNKETKIMVANYDLPLLEDIYNIEKISYISTREEFKTETLKPKIATNYYNNIIYQICLRTLYEIFELDKTYNFVDAIIFNGLVSYNEKSSGKHRTDCICSIQTTKKEFRTLDLRNIDPKSCFKLLKGIGAAELNSITPINPIRSIDKNDSRFIDAYSVLDTINSGTNLAAIHWKDFENLIREVFEKEFSRYGGDVKITQSSRDGGVDAVAFDPDPIRGGKIVIQAKRYTNVVGVSSVRDLYGTLMNEGANSGILVTTSDYGSDAYEFAKGKPINLLNGAQLLGLMKKHGYDCYINLQEAKKILQEEK
ncbi:restriction endonuclease [bacterium]|nr:restriction endonuclease [bacterium]